MLATASSRPLEKLDPEVRVALRIGCFQARFLDRVPSRAAVSESVELVKQARKRSAAGFVNAVLRRLPERFSSEEALSHSHPKWLAERWRARWGEGCADGILAAGLEQPATYLRLNPRFNLDETRAKLSEEGVETATAEIETAVRLLRGRPQATSCWRQGRVRIQDLSSQLVVPLLRLTAEGRLLDLCAAPGGKTRQAIELRGSAAGVVAADLHLHRLRQTADAVGAQVALATLNATRPLPFRRCFERILVDAPCSGTGTLARNPEIKRRLRFDDLAELAVKQRGILTNALDVLAPAGALVYSTCSLEREENEAVVEAVLDERPGFRTTERLERIPGRDAGDGFFACRIERV